MRKQGKNLVALGLCLLPAAMSAGAARTSPQSGQGMFSLYNGVVKASWVVTGEVFKPVRLTNWHTAQALDLPADAFVLVLSDGSEIHSSEMRVVEALSEKRVSGDPHASCLSERLAGAQATLTLEDPGHRVRAAWHGVLRVGSHYIRQQVTLTAENSDLPLKEIRLIDMDLSGAVVTGKVQGSPVTAGNLFMGFENPLSDSEVKEGHVRCALGRALPLKAGQSLTCSSVIGFATTPDQMRRDFLAYVERERAHPYRTFLHYNSWYDLGYGFKFDEKGALDRIDTFGRELHEKRGVALDSYLFDDGWDDPTTLWNFWSGFPQGFTPLKGEAEKYGAAVGVWMSPWGGYGDVQKQRLRYGAKEGFEMNEDGFELSGPVYYRRFLEVCSKMIHDYGVNQFKFDGTGNVNSAIPGSEFGTDFEAMIHLIGELRQEKPDLYVNLTTGTWPSPFWLRYADSIWRGGEDHSFAGVGTDRQRWITYRDGDTYQRIVQQGPLYPLNSLMLHGLIFAKYAEKLGADPKDDFADEVHDYFGTGTQLQEMYITPSLLTQENWNTLAEAARWSRRNAKVLVDTHWLGGDPNKLEVYGWASWTPQKGIITLRNPSDTPQSFDIDVQKAFELPASAPQRYSAHSPWRGEGSQPVVVLTAHQPTHIDLKPFEVMTLEATP